jgi:hypothetical protein
MNLTPGQGLHLKGRFANGKECPYLRPYLIIDVDKSNSRVIVLNVSGSLGKEKKLLYPSNLNLANFKPPFVRPSFVKLDEVYEINYFSGLEDVLLDNGTQLDSKEFARVKSKFHTYSQNNKVAKVSYSETYLKSVNTF